MSLLVRVRGMKGNFPLLEVVIFEGILGLADWFKRGISSHL